MSIRLPTISSGQGLAFFRDLAVLIGGQVGSRIIGFFVFAYLARTLDPQGYGAVEYVVALAVFFTAVVDGGFGVVGVRRMARNPGDLPTLVAQVSLVRLGLTVVGVPLMVLVGMPTMNSAGGGGLVWLFALSLLAAPWRHEWLLQATERMTAAAMAQFLRMIVFAIAVLWLVRSSSDILAVGWAEIAAACAMTVYCATLQHVKITPLRFSAATNALAGLAKEGIVVGLGNSVWTASLYMPLVLVANLTDATQTAWFAAASRIIGSLLAFTYVYNFNLYPSIARAAAADRQHLTAILATSFRIVAWGGTFVALSLGVLGQPLVASVFGARFQASAPILSVMAWTVPMVLLSGHARLCLIAAGMQGAVLYAQLGALLTILGLGVPLIMLLGGLGAALACDASFLAGWAAMHAFAVRRAAALPPLSIASRPIALALLIIGTVQVVGAGGWSAGLGLVLFAVAAPLLDRSLWPDLWRLGSMKREQPPTFELPPQRLRKEDDGR